MDNSNLHIVRDIVAATTDLERALKEEFLHLPEDVLTKRPFPTAWSIDETAAHVTIVMEMYLALIKEGLRNNEPVSNPPQYKPGFNGRLMIKLLAPKDGKVRYKMPTFASMEPQSDSRYSTIERLDDLLTTLKNFRELAQECARYDLNRVKVSSALGALLRFRLGDALHIVAAHNDRHLIQMQNTLCKVHTSANKRQQAS